MSRSAALPGRVAVLLLAAVCAVVGALALRGDDRCQAVVERARTLTPADVASVGPQLTRDALERCGAATDVIAVVSIVAVVGARADATEVTRELALRRPQDYRVWLTLGRLERDPARSRAALRRARELNPRGVPAPR